MTFQIANCSINEVEDYFKRIIDDWYISENDVVVCYQGFEQNSRGVFSAVYVVTNRMYYWITRLPDGGGMSNKRRISDISSVRIIEIHDPYHFFVTIENSFSYRGDDFYFDNRPEEGRRFLR